MAWPDPGVLAVAVGLGTGVLSFWLGRRLSKHWREKRRREQAAAARASETRQQRRARERRARRGQPGHTIRRG